MIFLTGSKGYIGSKLLDELMEEEGVMYTMDLQEGEDILFHSLPDTDIVYHLAAQTGVPSSWKNPVNDARQNILATVKLAQECSNKKVIYTSSAAAEKATSPYGLSKRTGADYLKMFVNNLVICILPNIFGDKGKGVIHRFLTDDPINVHGGEQTRTFVHVKDIVKALVKAKDWDPGTYYLGGPKPVSVNELAEATGKKMNITKMRKGDVVSSKIPNTAPNWNAKINVLDYVHEDNS